MTIRDCPKCGGIHWGQHECPFVEAPVHANKEPTLSEERQRATIAELEAILNSPDGDDVHINPDGTIARTSDKS